MDTTKLQQVLTNSLDELADLSPLEIDVKLGISRGQTSATAIAKALASFFQIRTNRLKEKPAITVVILNSDTTSTEYRNCDIVVGVGEVPLQIKIGLKVPPSVGVFLGIPRFKISSTLLPGLTEAQRELFAALSVLTGEEPSKILAGLINGALIERLEPTLIGETALNRRQRQLLVDKSLFPSSLLAHLRQLTTE